MVLLVVFVLVVVSSQLTKCAYKGWYLTKLMVGVMVGLVVLVLVVVSSCWYWWCWWWCWLTRIFRNVLAGGGIWQS